MIIQSNKNAVNLILFEFNFSSLRLIKKIQDQTYPSQKSFFITNESNRKHFFINGKKVHELCFKNN